MGFLNTLGGEDQSPTAETIYENAMEVLKVIQKKEVTRDEGTIEKTKEILKAA